MYRINIRIFTILFLFLSLFMASIHAEEPSDSCSGNAIDNITLSPQRTTVYESIPYFDLSEDSPLCSIIKECISNFRNIGILSGDDAIFVSQAIGKEVIRVTAEIAKNMTILSSDSIPYPVMGHTVIDGTVVVFGTKDYFNALTLNNSKPEITIPFMINYPIVLGYSSYFNYSIYLVSRSDPEYFQIVLCDVSDK